MQSTNRQIVLVRRPDGAVEQSCFEQADGPIPVPGPGEALIRNRLIAIDPAIRGWLNARGSGYMPGVELGHVVRASGVGEVVESNLDGYPVGTIVTAMTSWQDYTIITTDPTRPFEFATPVAPNVTPLEAATVFSHSGWTAYIGVHRILDVRPDDTVLVTAGASLVGSLAGQLARRAGARVIGTASSAAKCAWCVDDLGFEACIDYRAGDLDQGLKEHFPKGISKLFDNVGGTTLDTALRRIGHGACIALCGSISTDDTEEPYLLANHDRLMSRRATMCGFNTIDHLDLVPEIVSNYRAWLDDGSLIYRANISRGLESAPAALVSLYGGSGIGKSVIELE